MQVQRSAFLQAAKPLLQSLVKQLSEKYGYVSVLAADTRSKYYRVGNSGVSAGEDDLFTGRGFVLKVYDGRSYGEYSFTHIDEEAIPAIMAEVEERLMPLTGLPEGLTLSEYGQIPDEPATLLKSSEYAIHPEEKGDEAILSALTDIRKTGKGRDERVLDCIASFEFQEIHKLFLSPHRDLEQNLLWSCGSIYAMCPKDGDIVGYYDGASDLGGAEVLDALRAKLDNAVTTALELIDSQPMVPGEYECVCTPAVTGMIVHEAFGHGVEMDMFVKDRAQAKQFIDQYVASPLVTMHDGAAAKRDTGSYFFDDEGVLSHDTVIIDKGILRRGLSDAQSAMHLGTVPTGNGRRESFERKAYTRMTNTYFEPGTDTLEDMIASVKDGFLLDNPSSGMEDPKNWGIQCMVNVAREIKDGKLTGRIFSPIVLTGYVPDLLKSITMVSRDFALEGGGMCGKGWKEWVKVSDGGPCIKARIRLG